MDLFKNSLLYLAPMAGFTDFAFREVCKDNSADVVISEMISSRGLYYNDKKTFSLLSFSERQKPFGIQLFGNDAKIFSYAIEKVLHLSPSFIDINMGCPTPKIVQNGDGSALMKDQKLVENILNTIVRDNNIPITVKIRTGWDETSKNAVEIAKIAENAGVRAVFIHGRTRKQMYTPPVDITAIADVVSAVSIPIIANGDIKSPEDAQYMLTATKANGIMIGRASIGNPFIFDQIKKSFSNEQYLLPSIYDIIETAKKQLTLMVKDKGDRAIVEARPHLTAYIKGIKNCNKYKVLINSASSYNELCDILDEIKKRILDEKNI